MEENIPIEKADFSQFFKLLNLGRLKMPLIFAGLFLGIIETMAGLIIPLFTRDLIDYWAIDGIDTNYIFLLIVAFIIQTITGGISFYLMTYAGESLVANLREHFWSHVLELRIPYFDRNESGALMSRIIQDTTVIKSIVSDHIVNTLNGLISILGSIILLLMIDWKITLFIFFAVPITMVIIMPLGRKMYQISLRTQDELAKFSGHLGRVLNDIRLVKSYNAQPIERETGKKEIGNLMRFGLREAKIYAIISPIISMVVLLVLVIVVGYGGARVASGQLSAGSLVAIIIYLFQIVIPFSTMASFFTTFQKALGATKRINEILAEDREELGQLTPPDFQQTLQFEEVSFSYNDEQQVLKQVSFTIEPGKTYAFVGPSGGGKTTIFSLIERFYKPKEGRITLGGENIENIDLFSWRDSLGYVSQEIPVISGTVKKNICYGLDKEPTDQEIEEAARLAHAHEFIEKLPEGYYTEVGERGIKLSGGQRQRIAIARTILKNPKLLLLDEATSNLDSESEEHIQEAIKNVMKDRTTLIIAHRLSTVTDADTIFVVEGGKITGEGSHLQLMDSHPLYRKLVEHQFMLS